ncbi:hypothetical protein [Azospirillum rugosum]
MALIISNALSASGSPEAESQPSGVLSSVERWIEEGSLVVACQRLSACLEAGQPVRDEDREALILLLNAVSVALSTPHRQTLDRQTPDRQILDPEWAFDGRAFQVFADMVDVLRVQNQQIVEVMAIAHEVR